MRCQGTSTVRSAGLSEQRFQLGETPDRLEVRTVGRQEEKPRADGANGPAHRMALVAAEIVHETMSPGLSVGTENCSI